jgi:ribosomal protein S7
MELLMRDTKLINAYVVQQAREKKRQELFKVLKKEVETGANGTQDYIIKKGINKDKIAKK